MTVDKPPYNPSENSKGNHIAGSTSASSTKDSVESPIEKLNGSGAVTENLQNVNPARIDLSESQISRDTVTTSTDINLEEGTGSPLKEVGIDNLPMSQDADEPSGSPSTENTLSPFLKVNSDEIFAKRDPALRRVPPGFGFYMTVGKPPYVPVENHVSGSSSASSTSDSVESVNEVSKGPSEKIKEN